MDRNQRKGPAAALLLTSFFLVIYLAMNGSFSLGERTQNPGSPLNQAGKNTQRSRGGGRGRQQTEADLW